MARILDRFCPLVLGCVPCSYEHLRTGIQVIPHHDLPMPFCRQCQAYCLSFLVRQADRTISSS